MADPDVAAALERARTGDEDGLTTLYRTFQPPLVRYLQLRVGDAADDIASETWMAAARALPTLVGDVDDFRAWLFAVARNKLVDHHRAAARRPVTHSWGDGFDRAGGDDPADAVSDSVDSVAAVRALLKGLTSDQAEVVLLRVVAGFDVREVASMTGHSPAAVRVLQHRALRRMARRAAAPLQPGVP